MWDGFRSTISSRSADDLHTVQEESCGLALIADLKVTAYTDAHNMSLFSGPTGSAKCVFLRLFPQLVETFRVEIGRRYEVGGLTLRIGLQT